MKLHSGRPEKTASAIVIALVMVVILIALGTATFIAIKDKYRVVHQAGNWQEALESAEAGVEIGLTEIRRQLAGGVPFQAANDWQTTGTGGTSRSKTIVRSGEGGTDSWTIIRCDVPFNSATGEPWYRIRAHGYSRISGGPVNAGSGLDSNLRKLSLRHDRYSTQTDASDDGVFHADADMAQGPIAHRAVEAIIRPVSAFEIAMFGDDGVNFTDNGIYLDSFDSSNPTKSYWAPGATYGVYDPTKHTSYADIGTNGELINAKDATVYGTASTNGGDVLNSDNIMGHPGDPIKVIDNFSLTLGTVTAPSTAEEQTSPDYSGYTSTAQIPGDSTYDHVVQAGQTTTVLRVSSIDLQGKTLFIKGEEGLTTDAHIIVSGNMTISGTGSIVLDKNVRLRVFVSGDVKISGGGIANSGPALNFQLYGTSLDSNGADTPRSMNISGNGTLSGAIYAPTYDVKLNGGGSSGDLTGAVIARYVTMTGSTRFHYDEALGRGGLIANYKIAAWFEDER